MNIQYADGASETHEGLTAQGAVAKTSQALQGGAVTVAIYDQDVPVPKVKVYKPTGFVQGLKRRYNRALNGRGKRRKAAKRAGERAASNRAGEQARRRRQIETGTLKVS